VQARQPSEGQEKTFWNKLNLPAPSFWSFQPPELWENKFLWFKHRR
jgi:hypothetical protein